jgi:FHS family L-fucose permease-like MFS transporter
MIPTVCYVYIALFGYLGGRHAEREVAEIEAAKGAA